MSTTREGFECTVCVSPAELLHVLRGNVAFSWCLQTHPNRKWLDCSRSSQSMWLNSSRFFLLSCERKTFCSEFSRKKKNVLLNALCLLTSLSCQFFCSAFVVAKDLCASSFVSNRRCQRCPFDVECRPHTRHHLCSSECACGCFSVLAYVWKASCGCRCLHGCLPARVIMCVCAISRMGVETPALSFFYRT